MAIAGTTACPNIAVGTGTTLIKLSVRLIDVAFIVFHCHSLRLDLVEQHASH